jgi:HAD superfamily hydrolase (TIGR01549 family)
MSSRLAGEYRAPGGKRPEWLEGIVDSTRTTEGPRLPSPADGVIFDMDGTLVDTNYLHTICWWQALAQSGHDVSMAKVHRLVGMGAERLVRALVPAAVTDEQVARITTAHGVLFATWRERVAPVPGAEALLRWCWETGITTVVASSSTRRELDVMLEVLRSPDLDLTLSADDVVTTKPEPDLLAAARQWSGLGSEGVVVGDSVWDVEAAVKAGMPCIGLLCGGTSSGELLEAGAAAVVETPWHLLQEWSSALTPREGRVEPTTRPGGDSFAGERLR